MENILAQLENTKIPVTDNLYEEYDWFKKVFPLAAQKSSDGFFLPGFRFEMIAVSKNINLLMTKESYFVTKIRIDKLYDMFFRISETTVGMLLEKSLGRPNRSFNINRLTDLEGEIMTSFNDYMFRIMAKFLSPPAVVSLKRTNFDMIHLTFIVKDEDNEDSKVGKFIISIPAARMEANKIVSKEDKFEFSDFYDCPVFSKVQVGSTRIAVKDLKKLETEDIVILENSDINKFRYILKDYEKDFKINPNTGIEIPLEEELKMEENTENTNLWDSIEVDMYAEFDPVKMTLGNLKRIEQGLVVDVAALYDNKITLRVENKVIGHGELVIINDRYGVKISDIVERNTQSIEDNAAPIQNPGAPAPQQDVQEVQPSPDEPMPAPAGDDDEDEFDYSDFELEDEDI